MRVEINVQNGDEEISVVLTPETWDQTGDDGTWLTYSITPDNAIDLAAAKSKAALTAKIGES